MEAQAKASTQQALIKHQQAATAAKMKVEADAIQAEAQAERQQQASALRIKQRQWQAEKLDQAEQAQLFSAVGHDGESKAASVSQDEIEKHYEAKLQALLARQDYDGAEALENEKNSGSWARSFTSANRARCVGGGGG